MIMKLRTKAYINPTNFWLPNQPTEFQALAHDCANYASAAFFTSRFVRCRFYPMAFYRDICHNRPYGASHGHV